MRALSHIPRPRPAHAHLESTLDTLRSHYLEMPGLSLTATQAQRLCGLSGIDLPAFEGMLDRLVSERFLRRSRDGRYRRAA